MTIGYLHHVFLALYACAPQLVEAEALTKYSRRIFYQPSQGSQENIPGRHLNLYTYFLGNILLKAHGTLVLLFL